LSRNIQNKGTGYSGQGAGKERDTGYMRYGMKKEKKTGSWVEDVGLQTSTFWILEFGFWIEKDWRQKNKGAKTKWSRLHI